MLSTTMQLGKPSMYTIDGSFLVPINSPGNWMPMGDDPDCFIFATCDKHKHKITCVHFNNMCTHTCSLDL